MNRHVHFNLVSLFWTYIALLVWGQMMRFVFNKWKVAGLTEIVNAGP